MYIINSIKANNSVLPPARLRPGAVRRHPKDDRVSWARRWQDMEPIIVGIGLWGTESFNYGLYMESKERYIGKSEGFSVAGFLGALGVR